MDRGTQANADNAAATDPPVIVDKAPLTVANEPSNNELVSTSSFRYIVHFLQFTE